MRLIIQESYSQISHWAAAYIVRKINDVMRKNNRFLGVLTFFKQALIKIGKSKAFLESMPPYRQNGDMYETVLSSLFARRIQFVTKRNA